jgi:hypothetical protein
LDTAEGVEGKADIAELPRHGEFNDVPKTIAPPGSIACLGCSHRWGDKAGSCPIIETFHVDARERTRFPSTKRENMIDEVHNASFMNA